MPRTIKTASFTIQKRAVIVFRTGHVRQYTVHMRSYHTVLSDAEIRAVLYPYRKRAIYGPFSLALRI